MTKRLLTYALLLLLPIVLSAQEPTVKNIAVAPDSLTEDVIKLPFDDKGVDITVHFTFDEMNNKLTLAISGTRKLFVFERDTYIRQAFRGKWFSRKRMYPEKLMYPVLVQPKTKYYLARKVRKGYKKPRKQHLFNRWIEYSREIRTVVPKEFPLVIDSVVQVFDVHPKATKTSITLRNILVVDPQGGILPVPEQVNQYVKKKTTKYEFVHDKDMALTYNINLQRNPCFGMDARIDTMQTAVQEVKEAYLRLMKTSPEGKASSKAEEDVFNQHKEYLLSQYPLRDEHYTCGELQGYIDKYNNYIDSIANAQCLYEDMSAAAAKVEKVRKKLGLNAKMLLKAAHTLDDTAAKILVCKDPAQLHDLNELGYEIISSATVAIRQREVTTDEQKYALSQYKKAEKYFLRVSKK